MHLRVRSGKVGVGVVGGDYFREVALRRRFLFVVRG